MSKIEEIKLYYNICLISFIIAILLFSSLILRVDYYVGENGIVVIITSSVIMGATSIIYGQKCIESM